MKKVNSISKIRSNRLKYLKLFPLFIEDIDRTQETDDHWPCFQAKLLDDLILIPDAEQSQKLFRYGSFGKEEFARSTTNSSTSLPLEIVPNDRRTYEKPFRLRSILDASPIEIDDQTSDFERAFLLECQEKIFAESIDAVRQKNHEECQNVLDRTRLNSSSSFCRTEIQPSETTSTSKLIVYEHVYLLPEETIFLQHTFGCLEVRDELDHIYSPEELWQRFTLKDRNFPIKYAVYFHFRSRGWVVKPGLKFGCEYMLYRFGPTYNHADHCLSIENFWKENSSNWSFVAGLNRACLNAGKTLLITHVDLAEICSNEIENFLEQTKIRTLELHHRCFSGGFSSSLRFYVRDAALIFIVRHVSSLLKFFLYFSNKYYWSGTSCPSFDRMDGKIVLITGSNTGIGKFTAIELAKRGAQIILACRDRSRAEEALKEISQLSGSRQIEIELIDLASLKSIRESAKRLRDRLPKLDVLINNAGVMMAPGKSVDGYEIHFAVNHLGHFLLTNLLLDLMKKSPSARIINVSSITHALLRCVINWDDIHFEKAHWRIYAYSHSKLANILFTNELARRLKGTNITANSLHPGVARTEVIRYMCGPYQFVLTILLYLIMPIWWCFSKNLIQSAQTSIYLASDRTLEGVTGKYFSDCQERPSSKASLDVEEAERLWRLSEEMTNLRDALKEIRNE